MSQPTSGAAASTLQAAPVQQPVVHRVAYFGFNGPIDSGAVTRICGALNTAVNNGYNEIYLAMNSPGGYIPDGIFLYNHIQALPIPVTMHNTGSVSSVATTIFVAAQRRLCAPNAIFMMHPVALNATGLMGAKTLKASLQSALHEEQRTDAILRERARIPEDLLAKRLSEDIYMTAQEALQFGLVHEIGQFSLPAGSQIFQI